MNETAVKVGGLTYETVVVTPSMAKSWLENAPPGQRAVVQEDVDRLGRVFEKNGIIVAPPQALLFDEEGRLADGHHRCTLLVQKNITAQFMVARNVPQHVLYAMHDIRARSRKDQLAMQCQVKNSNLVSAVGTMLYVRWNFGQHTTSVRASNRVKLSAFELLEVFKLLEVDTDSLFKATNRIVHSMPMPLFSPTEIAYALLQQAPGIEDWLTRLCADTADRDEAQKGLRKWAQGIRNTQKRPPALAGHCAIAKAYNNPALRLMKVMEVKVPDLKGGRFEKWSE